MKRNLHAGGTRSRGLSVNVFTESELDDIHLATLEVLERTGVFVEDDEALDIFEDGGCARRPRDAHGAHPAARRRGRDRARAPSKSCCCGRDPKNDIVMEPGRVAFTNFSEGIRSSTRTPASTASRPSRTSPTSPASTTTSARSTRTRSPSAPRTSRRRPRPSHNTEAQLLNTTKPIGIGPLSGLECSAILRDGAEVAGGEDELRERPIVVRRRLPGEPAQAAAATPPRSSSSASRWGIPDNILSMAMAGGSARSRSPARSSRTTPRCSPASRSRSSPSAAAR